MPFLMISAFVFERFEFSRICFYGLPVTVATVPTKCVLNFTDLTFLRKIFSQIFGNFCQNATRSLLPTKKRIGVRKDYLLLTEPVAGAASKGFRCLQQEMAAP